MLIVNKKDTRTMLTIKTPVRRHEYHSYVFFVNFNIFHTFF